MEDLLDLTLLPSTDEKGVQFTKQRLQDRYAEGYTIRENMHIHRASVLMCIRPYLRLMKYNKFTVSQKLQKYLGETESLVEQARDRGTEQHVDNQMSTVLGKVQGLEIVLSYL